MRCTRGVNPRPQEARHGVGCRYGVLQHSQERIEVRVPDCCHRFPLVTNDQLCADRPAEFDGRSDLNECRQRDFLSLLPEPLSGLGSWLLAPDLQPRLSAFRRRSARITAGVFLSTLQWVGQRPTFDRSAGFADDPIAVAIFVPPVFGVYPKQVVSAVSVDCLIARVVADLALHLNRLNLARRLPHSIYA
jgi:hypothetical protein